MDKELKKAKSQTSKKFDKLIKEDKKLDKKCPAREKNGKRK
jgi:hypothetical protein